MVDTDCVINADNLVWLDDQPDAFVDLVYIDPPFNTGKPQMGVISRIKYEDNNPNYQSYMRACLKELRRVLKPNGSIFVHLDFREVHYVKIMLDELFGRECFMNEIIWAYDYGGRSKRKWSAKHDSILWYAKDPKHYTFNYDEMDRIPYMAPGLVGAEKAARGKTPTDVWWHTIVSPNGKEKTGYPTQKPLGILNRIVRVHSNPGDVLLDCFAGSGSFGVAAALADRRFILVDEHPEACRIANERLGLD